MIKTYTFEELVNRVQELYTEKYLTCLMDMLEEDFKGVESISVFEEDNKILSIITGIHPQCNFDNELLIYDVLEIIYDFDSFRFFNGCLIAKDGEVLLNELEYASFLQNDVVVYMFLGEDYYCYSKYVNNELMGFHSDFQSEIIESGEEYEMLENENSNLFNQINNAEEAIDWVKENHSNYLKLPKKFQLNEDVAVIFMDKFNLGFYFLNSELLKSEVIADYQIIQKGNYSSYAYFNDSIKSQKKYYELAIKDSLNMIFVPAETQNQIEFAYTVINISPNRLSSLMKIWRDNEEIVKYCLQKDGLTLYYASDRLKRNEEIINIAVNQNPEARKYDLRIDGNENNKPYDENDDLPF